MCFVPKNLICRRRMYFKFWRDAVKVLVCTIIRSIFLHLPDIDPWSFVFFDYAPRDFQKTPQLISLGFPYSHTSLQIWSFKENEKGIYPFQQSLILYCLTSEYSRFSQILTSWQWLLYVGWSHFFRNIFASQFGR